MPRPPESTLFPYTTLFRSKRSFRLTGADGGPLRGDVTSAGGDRPVVVLRSEEHMSELQSTCNVVCRLVPEKKKGPAPPTVPTYPLRSILISVIEWASMPRA